MEEQRWTEEGKGGKSEGRTIKKQRKREAAAYLQSSDGKATTLSKW